jgi:hypothetical protein
MSIFDLHKRLKVHGAAANLDMTEVILRLIREYLEKVGKRNTKS